jgi:hypothetical protein
MNYPTATQQTLGGREDNDGIDLANVPVCSADWGGRGCRVIGCEEDIYSQRAVNLKYRLCKTHKSAEVLLVNGLPKRFCSQCSTFKLVSDFNGKMRACRTCLRHRSESRSVKREFLNTFMAADHSGVPQPQSTFGGTVSSAAVMENAQIEAFMAGAALAEILRNNGDREPVATAAAMANAAAKRGASHQPLRIVSTSATTANGDINQTGLQSPVPSLTTEALQQESALAALLAAAAATAGTPTLAAPGNDNNTPPSPYQAFLDDAKESVPSPQPHQQPPQQQQQQQPPQQQPPPPPQQQQQQPLPPPFLAAPEFHSLVQMHHLQQDPISTTASISTSRQEYIISQGFELKRQRVLAELHLARTNLELAQVEEEIYKIRQKQQQQQQQRNSAAAAIGAGGSGKSSKSNVKKKPAAPVREYNNDQRPGTPKNL